MYLVLIDVLQEEIDGNFISTDIRYCDGPIVPKPKSKRRSASSYFTPSASTIGNSVGGVCGGAEGASNAPVMESVGGEDISVVGGDDMGNLYI